MDGILEFLISAGKLKETPRRGWILRGLKNPETIAAHTFRIALMAWLLGFRKKINVDKVIKMALIHDLCEVCAGDATPYDNMLPTNKREAKKLMDTWPRQSKKKKQEFFNKKYRREHKALKMVISKLPSPLKVEITYLWDDYEKGLTREGRFVRQLDRLENLLQALEYWKKGSKFAIEPWWVQIEELIDDPILLDFMVLLEKKFHK